MSTTVASVNDILKEDEGGLSGFTILAILATLLMVFVLVVYYAYRQGVARASSFSEEIPVVAADPNPVAEDVPLDVAKNERQEVYDRVSGALPTRTVTLENPNTDAMNGYGSAPAKLSPTTTLPAPSVQRPDPAVTALTEAARDTDRLAGASTTSGAPTRQVPAPSTKPRDIPVRASSPTATPTTAISGSHVVQVGAFDSNAAALDYFEGLSGRLGSLVASKQPDVQRAEVNGRTFYRLRIGPFTSKDAATQYCSTLKARSQDCLVRGV
ncbi:MAG: SPOR domain-containing protein [Pseudomonadota bacterium]